MVLTRPYSNMFIHCLRENSTEEPYASGGPAGRSRSRIHTEVPLSCGKPGVQVFEKLSSPGRADSLSWKSGLEHQETGSKERRERWETACGNVGPLPWRPHIAYSSPAYWSSGVSKQAFSLSLSLCLFWLGKQLNIQDQLVLCYLTLV